VSNFAQTLSIHASRNYFNAILRSPKCGGIRPFDKGSDISVIAIFLIVTVALGWGLAHI
jgi:hypothetical protein